MAPDGVRPRVARRLPRRVLRDIAATGSNDAIRTFSPNLQVVGGRISGSTTGIDTGAATTINGTAITEVDQGVRARTGEVVHVDGIDVSAISAGINVAAGSPVILTDSRVDALEAVRGQVQLEGINQLSLPPLNLLGAIGVPLILLALVLEQVQAIRQRGFRGARRRVPPTLPPRPMSRTESAPNTRQPRLAACRPADTPGMSCGRRLQTPADHGLSHALGAGPASAPDQGQFGPGRVQDGVQREEAQHLAVAAGRPGREGRGATRQTRRDRRRAPKALAAPRRRGRTGRVNGRRSG